MNPSLYQTHYFICNELRCGIANTDTFNGLKFVVSFCTGSCWKDSQINSGHEPLLYSVSHHYCKAGSVWGVWGVCQGPSCHRQTASWSWGHLQFLATPLLPQSPWLPGTACYKELFQLTVGSVLVTAGQTPGCQGEHWLLWGLSQAPLHPRPPQSSGVSISTALGMAALQKSNAGKAVTAPAVPHTGSNPASFSWWADILF